ncbi:uncharacterized protein METZ01_LOCUS471654, partial [marine metagenome]
MRINGLSDRATRPILMVYQLDRSVIQGAVLRELIERHHTGTITNGSKH